VDCNRRTYHNKTPPGVILSKMGLKKDRKRNIHLFDIGLVLHCSDPFNLYFLIFKCFISLQDLEQVLYHGNVVVCACSLSIMFVYFDYDMTMTTLLNYVCMASRWVCTEPGGA